MKAIADLLRWALILAIWFGVGYLLWMIAWFWAAIWVLPGLYLTVNIVGFATLPIYYLVGISDPKMREAKRMLDEIERDDSS